MNATDINRKKTFLTDAGLIKNPQLNLTKREESTQRKIDPVDKEENKDRIVK